MITVDFFCIDSRKQKVTQGRKYRWKIRRKGVTVYSLCIFVVEKVISKGNVLIMMIVIIMIMKIIMDS